MGIDSLSIISFNSSRRGLLALGNHSRPSYLQSILQNAEPDICFLPGDDKKAKLNVIIDYEQYTLPTSEDTVLLYNPNKVTMKRPKLDLNILATPELSGLDLNRMVVPEVEIYSPQPYQSIVKEFSMVSWTHDLFVDNHIRAEVRMESIIKFSQRLACVTGRPLLISGEIGIDISVLKSVINKLGKQTQEEFLAQVHPQLESCGFLPSMTKKSQTEQRHLFMMKVYQCSSGPVNGKSTLSSLPELSPVPDCFVASKQLELKEAKLLDVEQVTGRTITMPLLKTHKPTQTCMEIPVRPPRHHGG